MIGAALHTLPDGLLLDGRGGGRVMLAVAVVAFVGLALSARPYPLKTFALVLGGALVGGALAAWLADGLFTGTLTPPGLSLFGAALGGPIGAALGARGLGLGVRPTLDALALPGLVAAMLARVGCLVAGCDFGRAAPDAFFSLRYAAGTPAFEALARRGEVAGSAAMTGPLHAFPLYEIGLVALGALALVAVRRRLAPGVRAALAGATYFAARAVAELFRDGAAPAPSPLTLVASACALGALALAVTVRSRPLPVLGEP